MYLNICSVNRYIDSNKKKFIETLKDAVSIPSVSGDDDRRPDVVIMVKWAADHLRKMGATVELCDIGDEVHTY